MDVPLSISKAFSVQVIFFLNVPDYVEGQTSSISLNSFEKLPTEMSHCV